MRVLVTGGAGFIGSHLTDALPARGGGGRGVGDLAAGGAGFIGSHLTDALVARGDEVTVIDDLSAGRPGRLTDRAALHKLNVSSGPALTALVAELAPELICHLAAQIDVRASVAGPAADATANVVGTVHV